MAARRELLPEVGPSEVMISAGSGEHHHGVSVSLSAYCSLEPEFVADGSGQDLSAWAVMMTS